MRQDSKGMPGGWVIRAWDETRDDVADNNLKYPKKARHDMRHK